MKIHLIPLTIRKMQIKTIKRYCFIRTSIAIINKMKNNKCW